MKTYISSLIIGLAIVITAIVFASAIKNRNKANDTISVTGLGKKDFVSDLIVWSGSFNRQSQNLKEAYALLDKDRETIKSYLVSKGLSAENMVFSAVNIEQKFDEIYDDNGRFRKRVFTGYGLYQNVQIESKEVNKIEEISRQVTELINSGVEFYSNSPQYYYTKLAELKIEMIAEATKDAYNRAQKIASNAGGKVGRLKSADMGVFQITAQNSSEDFSWGGSFNTISKNKTASITIKLKYEIN